MIETLGLPRNSIRPDSTFAELIPRQKRQRVRQHLIQEKLPILDLSFSRFHETIALLAMIASFLLGFVVGIACMVMIGLPLLGLFVGVVVGFLGCFIGVERTYAFFQDQAVEVRPKYTVKDAVIKITRWSDYMDAGYEISKQIIFLRVREIV